MNLGSMGGDGKEMVDFMDHPLSRSAVLFAALFFVTAIGFAIARKFRDRSEAKRADRQQELMTKFRDLHARGGLSDEEYRTIKAKLAMELKSRFKDAGGAG